MELGPVEFFAGGDFTKGTRYSWLHLLKWDLTAVPHHRAMLHNKAVQEAKKKTTLKWGFGEWVGGSADYTFRNKKNSQWQGHMNDYQYVNAQDFPGNKSLSWTYLHITGSDLLSQHLCGRALLQPQTLNSFRDVPRSQVCPPLLFFIMRPHRNIF